MSFSKYEKLNKKIHKAIEEDRLSQKYDTILEYAKNAGFSYHTLNLIIKANLNRKNREVLNQEGIVIPGISNTNNKPEDSFDWLTGKANKKLENKGQQANEESEEPEVKSENKTIEFLNGDTMNTEQDDGNNLDFWIYLMVFLTFIMISLIIFKLFF